MSDTPRRRRGPRGRRRCGRKPVVEARFIRGAGTEACPGAPKSIELRADGTFVVLADDGAGGLKPAQGLDSEGQWAPQDGSPPITPGPMLPELEKAPRRMRITAATSCFQNWFVRSERSAGPLGFMCKA